MTSIKQLLILTSFFFISISAVAGVYKWTDANGKVHFSDKPHKNANEITIKVYKPSGVGQSSSQLKRQQEMLLQLQNNRLEKNNNKRKRDKRDARIARQCKRLKNQILNYKEVDYLFTRNSDGSKVRLSGAKKKQETAILQKEYDEKCS